MINLRAKTILDLRELYGPRLVNRWLRSQDLFPVLQRIQKRARTRAAYERVVLRDRGALPRTWSPIEREA